MIQRPTIGETLAGGMVLAAISLTTQKDTALVLARFGPDYVTALWDGLNYSKLRAATNRRNGMDIFLRRITDND